MNSRAEKHLIHTESVKQTGTKGRCVLTFTLQSEASPLQILGSELPFLIDHTRYSSVMLNSKTSVSLMVS